MLEMKTAEELIDPELEARWADRRIARLGNLLPHILRVFAEQGGPVRVDEIAAAFPELRPADLAGTLATLDEKDLIQVRAGRVEIAYPFSAFPTPFVVRLTDGRERYACCAIDALGVAPMLGEAVQILSCCHDCEAPLKFSVRSDGPGADAAGVVVWVGRWSSAQRRMATSL